MFILGLSWNRYAFRNALPRYTFTLTSTTNEVIDFVAWMLHNQVCLCVCVCLCASVCVCIHVHMLAYIVYARDSRYNLK